MFDGNLALQLPLQGECPAFESYTDSKWTNEDYYQIAQKISDYGCMRIRERDEYIIFKEEVLEKVTEDLSARQVEKHSNTEEIRAKACGVISPFCSAIVLNDTNSKSYNKSFLAAFDVQKNGSISNNIPSFKAIQSERMSLNIGFDTEFQDFRDECERNRLVLSLQMSIEVGGTLIRYFFLVNPRFQEVTAEGGRIPLKYCLADILCDLKTNYVRNIPLLRKDDLIYKDKRLIKDSVRKTEDFEYLEFKDFKCREDNITNKQSTIESPYPVIIDITNKLYGHLHNITCAAAAAAQRKLISVEEFYAKYKGPDVEWEEYVAAIREHLKHYLTEEEVNQYLAQPETVDILNEHFTKYIKSLGVCYSPASTAYCLWMLY